jgi:hypothetical protein
MVKKSQKKPVKKKDSQVYSLTEDKIAMGEYIFLNHAKQRLKDRSIIDIDVLDILEGKKDRNRRRNKSKDKYELGHKDWNYCIEGSNLDGIKIRIIISFDEDNVLVITVIRLN